VLFSPAAATVLLATLYPMALEAFTGARISVGAPYFEAVLGPLLAPAVFLMAIGPVARWRRAAVPSLLRRLQWAGTASLATGAALLMAGPDQPWRIPAALGVALGCWVVLGTLTAAFHRLRSGGRSALTRRAAGLWMAHLGAGVFVLALSMLRAGEVEREVAMQPGQSADLGAYRVRLEALRPLAAHNHDAMQAHFSLLDRNGQLVAALRPESRAYRTQDMTVSVPAIDTGWTRDVYVALGNPTGGESWGVRLQVKPMMSWLWLGFLMAAAGAAIGALSSARGRPEDAEQPAQAGAADAGLPSDGAVA
jgi:cytochrome c-type biogenesis protein CcmF